MRGFQRLDAEAGEAVRQLGVVGGKQVLLDKAFVVFLAIRALVEEAQQPRSAG